MFTGEEFVTLLSALTLLIVSLLKYYRTKEISYAMRVEDSKIILERIPDPFELALKGPKFAKITFEEFERESEEMQDELFGEA